MWNPFNFFAPVHQTSWARLCFCSCVDSTNEIKCCFKRALEVPVSSILKSNRRMSSQSNYKRNSFSGLWTSGAMAPQQQSYQINYNIYPTGNVTHFVETCITQSVRARNKAGSIHACTHTLTHTYTHTHTHIQVTLCDDPGLSECSRSPGRAGAVCHLMSLSKQRGRGRERAWISLRSRWQRARGASLSLLLHRWQFLWSQVQTALTAWLILQHLSNRSFAFTLSFSPSSVSFPLLSLSLSLSLSCTHTHTHTHTHTESLPEGLCPCD